MRSNLVEVTPPILDEDLRIHPVRKPLHAQTLVPELPVEALVRFVLPGFTRIDMRNINLALPSAIEGSLEIRTRGHYPIEGTSVRRER